MEHRTSIQARSAGARLYAGLARASPVQRGDIKLIGWVGDETPWQIGVAFTSAKTANDRRATVRRFLHAYRRAASDYHAAFTGANEERADGPTAPEVLAIIAKNLNQSAETINIPYVDAEGRLHVKDILHQIAWYKSQGMVKPEVDGGQIIDERYVMALPAN